MGQTIRLWADESLKEVLERIRKEVALDLKKVYGLNEVTIEGTLASQVLAAKMNGRNVLDFKIRKTGLNKGILELI